MGGNEGGEVYDELGGKNEEEIRKWSGAQRENLSVGLVLLTV